MEHINIFPSQWSLKGDGLRVCMLPMLWSVVTESRRVLSLFRSFIEHWVCIYWALTVCPALAANILWVRIYWALILRPALAIHILSVVFVGRRGSGLLCDSCKGFRGTESPFNFASKMALPPSVVKPLLSSLVVQMVMNLPAMWETWVRSLGWEDPLEEGMATHSSILAWRSPWTEERGGLQSMGSQRVGRD